MLLGGMKMYIGAGIYIRIGRAHGSVLWWYKVCQGWPFMWSMVLGVALLFMLDSFNY